MLRQIDDETFQLTDAEAENIIDIWMEAKQYVLKDPNCLEPYVLITLGADEDSSKAYGRSDILEVAHAYSLAFLLVQYNLEPSGVDCPRYLRSILESMITVEECEMVANRIISSLRGQRLIRIKNTPGENFGRIFVTRKGIAFAKMHRATGLDLIITDPYEAVYDLREKDEFDF